MNVYNLVSLSGRLTADPELKTTQSGISNCRICIAVNRPYQKDKEQEADFINANGRIYLQIFSERQPDNSNRQHEEQ